MSPRHLACEFSRTLLLSHVLFMHFIPQQLPCHLWCISWSILELNLILLLSHLLLFLWFSATPMSSGDTLSLVGAIQVLSHQSLV